MKFLRLYTIIVLVSSARAFGIKHDWAYEFLDVTNEGEKHKFDVDLKIERTGRDDFALSGTIDIKVDLTDETFVEATFERSATGSADYKTTPFQVPRTALTGIMSGPYAKFLMASIKNCAPQAPQFEGKFEAPFTKRLIVANKCSIDLDNFPPHMQEGYYRLNIVFSGQIDVKIQVYLRIMPNLF